LNNEVSNFKRNRKSKKKQEEL
jgi:hypothetical protein